MIRLIKKASINCFVTLSGSIGLCYLVLLFRRPEKRRLRLRDWGEGERAILYEEQEEEAEEIRSDAG